MRDIVSELRRKLIELTEKNSVQGLLLSGGLDSAILACVNPHIRAITISLKSYGQDVKYAAFLTNFLSIEHYQKSVEVDEAIEAIPEVIKILKTFDPAIPNDLVTYFGLKLSKGLGINEVMTGDGGDELFAGYSFMEKIDNLEGYIRKMALKLEFSSNELGEFLNINIKQPYLDEEIMELALEIPRELKIKQENGKIWGKWILRKAFEDKLPGKIVWQDKRALEYGSGMTKIRRIISSKVCDEEFEEAKKGASSIKFLNKEHFYYYRIYENAVGEIPKPQKGEKECPGCSAGINPMAFHCKVCGYTFAWKV